MKADDVTLEPTLAILSYTGINKNSTLKATFNI